MVVSRFAIRFSNWSSRPQIGSGEIDEIVGAAVEHGFHHVEGEAFGHFDSNGGRDRKYRPAHHGIDQHRPVMGKCSSDTLVDVGGILKPDPAHAAGFSHGGKVRILEFGTEVEKARGFLLNL